MSVFNTSSESIFPDRKEISKQTYINQIVEQAKEIDVDKIDFNGGNFKPRSEIVEKQKVFFWIRVYLNQEISIEPNTDVKLTYLESGESLITKFITYAKKGTERNLNEMVINYNPEDDTKVLCLMIDSDRIDNNSNDIPFIRSLFRISRWYSPQILRLSDLQISVNDTPLEYYDIDF